jgi:hypothetical protein
VHSNMAGLDLYISAYSCLMADQTRTSQYVEVVLAWLFFKIFVFISPIFQILK